MQDKRPPESGALSRLRHLSTMLELLERKSSNGRHDMLSYLIAMALMEANDEILRKERNFGDEASAKRDVEREPAASGRESPDEAGSSTANPSKSQGE